MKILSIVLLGWSYCCLLRIGVAAFSTSPMIKSTGFIEELKTTPVLRASDGKSVTLPSLWRADTPFGFGDEIAVCAFLRHYG